MPRELTITSAPFKSSKLAIPPSPFSPRLPLSPSQAPPSKPVLRPTTKVNVELSPPPSEPLHWLWQCHICSRVYQLGVTRRCLDDGHLFCAGTTTVKRSRKDGRKIVRHKACASEFDYQGWKTWGDWRRTAAEQAEAAAALAAAEDNDIPMPLFTPIPPSENQWISGAWAKKPTTIKASQQYWKKDCWNSCDYPSECRWGNQYGVQTAAKATVTVPSSLPVEEAKSQKTSFDDILLDIPETIEEANESSDVDMTTPSSPEEPTKKPTFDDLLESAKRRKRRSAGLEPSPLALNPPGEADAMLGTASASSLQRAFDDFELDMRKSFERAGGLLASWVHGRKSSSALEEEKAEAFVKGLRVGRKKGQGGGSGSKSDC